MRNEDKKTFSLFSKFMIFNKEGNVKLAYGVARNTEKRENTTD